MLVVPTVTYLFFELRTFTRPQEVIRQCCGYNREDSKRCEKDYPRCTYHLPILSVINKTSAITASNRFLAIGVLNRSRIFFVRNVRL